MRNALFLTIAYQILWATCTSYTNGWLGWPIHLPTEAAAPVHVGRVLR